MCNVLILAEEANWSLITADNHWAVAAVIVVGVGLSVWLEQGYKWAAKVSAPLIALVMAMILSNLRIMPTGAKVAVPVYDNIDSYIVPLAIPLLLFRANIVRIVREAKTMFIAFHLAALGTLIGAAIAGLLFRGHIEQLAQVIGIMTGSYIGGGVNFGAVKESFDTPENLANPLIVADNFIMAAMFAVLFALAAAKWCLRLFPHPHTLEADDGDATNLAAEHWKPREISLLDLATALSVAFVIAATSALLAGVIQGDDPSFLRAILGNPFVLLTVLSVIVATVMHNWLSRIRGADEVGALFLLIYLFKIGLPADLLIVIKNVPLMFLLCLVIAATNLLVTLSLGKLLRLPLEELLVSVNATLGGPPTAVAMAISKGWSKLILPALLVGIWGYAIGTLLGITMGNLLMRM